MERKSRSGGSCVVIGDRAPGCVSCVRSLGRQGVRIIAASEDETTPAFASRYTDEAVGVPSPREELLAYRDALLALAGRDDVRTVVPVREEDVYVLSRYRDEFGERVTPLWPTFETLRTAQDRVRLIEAAEEAGVPVPETWLLDAVEDWDRELIVKARYALLTNEYDESLSRRRCVEMPKTRYPEPGVEPDRDALVAEMEHVPIVQEYVPGAEFTFRALYDHGEPVVTSQKRLIRGQKYPRGPSVFHAAVARPGLEAAGRRLLDHLDWHGLASVGFMEHAETGEFTLLEINPRVWSSLPCDLHAGVDYPRQYWRLAGGAVPRGEGEYATGRASHFLRGELNHLLSVVRDEFPTADRPPVWLTVREIVTSLYEHPRFDLLSFDDPRPFVRDVRNAVEDELNVAPLPWTTERPRDVVSTEPPSDD